MTKTEIAEEDRIYIDELCKLIHRKTGTVRKWEAEGKLPKSLLPRRGKKKRRYWTHTQVHGKRGIIAWMERNDMRPGNLVTDPSKEDQHVENLRRPKYLNGHHIRSARVMTENGRTREHILKRIFPRTKYAHVANLEKALEKVAALEGWSLPAPKPKPKPKKVKLTKKQQEELARLERRIERLTSK